MKSAERPLTRYGFVTESLYVDTSVPNKKPRAARPTGADGGRDAHAVGLRKEEKIVSSAMKASDCSQFCRGWLPGECLKCSSHCRLNRPPEWCNPKFVMTAQICNYFHAFDRRHVAALHGMNLSYKVIRFFPISCALQRRPNLRVDSASLIQALDFQGIPSLGGLPPRGFRRLEVPPKNDAIRHD